MRYDWARWFKPLGTVTPVFNSLLQTGDYITDLFSKVQGLLTWKATRSSITAAVSGGASTVADVNISSLTITANQPAAGDRVLIKVMGTITKPNAAGTTITFWAKINGTSKIGSVTYTPTAGLTTVPFCFECEVIFRTLGSSGTVWGQSTVNIQTAATTAIAYVGAGASTTINTTANMTIAAGFTFSNSNASNNVTANIAVIDLE